jgi:bifunctional non-homologous end joining protein LigD
MAAAALRNKLGRNPTGSGAIRLFKEARVARDLKTYQSMRDFAVTAEPSGKDPVVPSEQLRFVIQKHAATRLHYDLRLEYEGVFLSWAVTKGPSADPKDRRLAVEVEDHPLAYGDFEGTIPKGQYGGGTVMLWDRGVWAPAPGTTIEQGLKKGDLKVVFAGERMNGSWVLVRMPRREREKRDNWLLIKHRDGFEREGDGEALVREHVTSVASGRTMEEIAAGGGKAPTPFMTGVRPTADAVWRSNRDPEASAEAAAAETGAPKASAKSRPAAKAAPKPTAKGAKGKGKSATAMPDFIPPQLCKLLDRPPQGQGWAHEIKFDGYRLQLRVQDGQAWLRTRKGLDWTGKFKEIAADGARLPDGIYDGEGVALDAEGRPDFAGLQDALSTGRTGELVLFLFDCLWAEGEDFTKRPLTERKDRLKAALEEVPSPRLRYVDHFVTAGEAVLQSACRMDLEGIISKRLDAAYMPGRGDCWTKAKCRGGQEVVIGGWLTTNQTSFRSLLVGVHRDGRFVYVGKVGTGFSRDKVSKLLPQLKAVETAASPFEAGKPPRKGVDVHWTRPELVAEIEFAGWTGDGQVRQASFKGIREDKAAAEVVPETAKAAEALTSKAASTKPKASPTVPAKGSSVVLGVSISNAGKVLWPAPETQPEVTKLDLARYLESVAGWMIPHIKGRPCSLIRYPDGVNGKQRFFQRHLGRGASALYTSVDIGGDREPYIQLDTPEALIAAAQSGSLEYHPWNCEPFDPETPGRFVFDLDPAPDVPFDEVIRGALEVKERLEALGLNTFCKTTGGKGLHVVTPLKRSKVDWPTAKAFCREVCERMAADSPGRYLVNMSKAKRTGKIFLDYLRNDRMSTAVAPFSPRARPGAPVSMPVDWKAVKPGLDPMKFTLRTTARLFAKAPAWSGYEDAEASLPDAIKRLAGAARKRAA